MPPILKTRSPVRRSLHSSVFDGVCASASAAVTDNFVTPLAIALQASAAQIAALASLPSLIGALVQLQAGPLNNRYRRKPILLSAVGLQVVCLFLLAAFFWVPSTVRVPFIITTMIVFASSGAMATPLWASLMCEYLPIAKRSGYFGWRNRFLGGVTIIATFVGGMILHLTGRASLNGFMAILAVAAGLRFCSLKFLTLLHEPSRHEPAGGRATYRSFVRRNRSFMGFVMTVGLMGFSVSLTGPFLALYLLKGLHLSYALYTVILMSPQITMFWLMGRWGRNADRSGNMKVVQLTARFLPFTALLWIFSTQPLYLVIVQLFSGAVWAGYNLCVANFVYDSVRQEERVHATALFNMVNGVSAFAGAIWGGFLLTHLPTLWGFRFYSLILLGASLRWLTGWLIFPKLREVRKVTAISHREMVADLLTRPVANRHTRAPQNNAARFRPLQKDAR